MTDPPHDYGLRRLVARPTEHCILGMRGKPIVTLTNETTLLRAPVRGHSVKPIEFYDLAERPCPAPRYADVFSRYRHILPVGEPDEVVAKEN